MDTLHEINHSLDGEWVVSSYFSTENHLLMIIWRPAHKRYLTFPGQSLNLGCYMRLLLYNPIHYSTWPIINPQRDVKIYRLNYLFTSILEDMNMWNFICEKFGKNKNENIYSMSSQNIIIHINKPMLCYA